MNKKYIVRKNEDVQEIIGNKQKIVNSCFVIYFKDNSVGYSRFCISISKKFGKAHYRNLYKRRIKDILMKNIVKSSKDYVIIVREPVKKLSYDEIRNNLINILKG